MAVIQGVSNNQFREDFPEFKDTSVFTESSLTTWLVVATVMVNANVWDPDLLTLGIELFAAHNIVIEAHNNRSVSRGDIPGISKGAVSAKSQDKVSISYDVASTVELDAGHWNLTVFGTRFINIARMMGAAPLVSAPSCYGGAFGANSAWAGPISGLAPGWDPNDPGG